MGLFDIISGIFVKFPLYITIGSINLVGLTNARARALSIVSIRGYSYEAPRSSEYMCVTQCYTLYYTAWHSTGTRVISIRILPEKMRFEI